MKLRPDHAEWGGPNGDWYWFYWWNWLPRKYRYWGYSVTWYDGPIYTFGFWFVNWSWTSYWWARMFGTDATPYKPSQPHNTKQITGEMK